MKGLLYKDLTTIVNSYKKNALLVIALYTLLGLGSQMFFLLYALVFLFGMYTLSSLSFDEYCHWDMYARTLPVSTGALVASKYLLGLALMAGSVFLSMALLTAATFVSGGTLSDLGGHLCGCLASLALVLIYYGFSFPLSYKFGPSKARSWMLAVFAGFFAVGWFFITAADKAPASKAGWVAQLDAMSNEQVLGVVLILTALGLAVYLVSWAVSTAVYRAKEF